MNKIKVLDLFAGVGAFDAALDRLGVDYELVDAVEIDPYAMKAFNAIHGTDFECQDITKWDKDVGDIDIMWQSSPCTDISLAGKGEGADKGSGTRSSLVWEVIRIVAKVKPKVVIWENVKGLTTKKHKHILEEYIADLEKLGYTSYWKVLNSKNFCIPQNRERCYTISILGGGEYEFPQDTPLNIRLKDILDKDVDEKFYLSEERVQSIKFCSYNASNYSSRVRDPEGYSRTLTARDYKDPTCVQVGTCEAINGHDILKRIYSADGISTTLNTCGGGNTEVKIIDPQGRKNKVNNPPCAVIDDTYANRDARVYEDSAPTLRGERNGLKVAEPFIVASRGRNPNNPSDRTVGIPTEQRLEAHTDGVSNTLTSVTKDNYVGEMQPNLRVRKLTPSEYFKLQGFTEGEFKRAEKVISNSRLYKCAGNSVTVSVIVALLSQLGVGKKKWNAMSDEEREQLIYADR